MAISVNMRGALFMSVAMAAFTANDAATKVVSESMSMAQVMAIRGAFATLAISVLVWWGGALRRPANMFNPYVLLRSACEALATVAFLVALTTLALGTIAAILSTLPLAVTVAAALFLDEKVHWRRWLAICVGFAGVVIIVRPGGEGFDTSALWALASVVFCAVRDLATKRVPDHVPTLLVSTVTAALVTVTGILLVEPMGGWKAVSPASLTVLGLAAALLLIGYQFTIRSMRVADISFIAPFRYTGLLWAILLGFLLFGDVPDLAMIIGAATIAGSGLYTLYRERVAGGGRPAAKSTGPTMAPDGV